MDRRWKRKMMQKVVMEVATMQEGDGNEDDGGRWCKAGSGRWGKKLAEDDEN